MLDEPIARAWLADLPRTSAIDDGSIWPSSIAVARIAALAGAAPRLGLAREVAAILEQIAASPTPSPGAILAHPLVVRAANIALATMEPP